MITLKDAITITRDFCNEAKKFKDINAYEEHVISVGACASVLASSCGLDVMKAGLMGYCHDIGKIINNEKKNKTFHGLTGYEYFKSVGENELAQICLTHSFPSFDFENDEYISYGEGNIEKARKILQSINLTDYDRIIQLSDLLVNFNGKSIQYDNIKDRMNYIEKEYNVSHHHILKKYKKTIKLKKYIEQKYQCNVYKLLGIK